MHASQRAHATAAISSQFLRAALFEPFTKDQLNEGVFDDRRDDRCVSQMSHGYNYPIQ